mgnify:CR=1 FL=1
MQRNGLVADYQHQREAGIKAVTADDVQRIAKRILVEDDMTTFLVGQPKGITPTKTYENID